MALWPPLATSMYEIISTPNFFSVSVKKISLCASGCKVRTTLVFQKEKLLFPVSVSTDLCIYLQLLTR